MAAEEQKAAHEVSRPVSETADAGQRTALTSRHTAPVKPTLRWGTTRRKKSRSESMHLRPSVITLAVVTISAMQPMTNTWDTHTTLPFSAATKEIKAGIEAVKRFQSVALLTQKS